MPGDRDRSMSGIGEIKIESLAGSLMRKQEGAAAEQQHWAMASSHQLSRVPVHLRDKNASDYTPGFVAIGPLHSREDRRLRPAERLKVAYLNNLILRGHPDPAHHLAVIQEYIRVVSAREQEARAMYAGEEVADIVADDFVQMMVLDGCFIIEHLVNVATGREEPSLHATPFGPMQLSIDLVLAENQMPFFVLVDLIASTKLPEFQATGYQPPVLLVKLVLYYLAGEKGCDISVVLPAADGVTHILHLFHEMITAARIHWEPPAVTETAQEAATLLRRLLLLLFVPLHLILPEDKRRSASYGQEGVPLASDLRRMGVRLTRARGVSGSKSVAGVASVLGPVPLAVKLTRHGDLLHLPQLRLEFRTAPVLLNLMAFEQSASRKTAPEVSASRKMAPEVSSYVYFMAKMVQSAEDAGVLMTAGVVGVLGHAYERKEKVARFLRAMGAASEAAAAGELLETSYLGRMPEKLRERSDHQLFVMRADVQRNYITLLAELLTLITFVSTIIQTYAALARH